MISIDLSTILTIVGAIMAPLLTVIGVLYLGRQADAKDANLLDDTRIKDYNTMRDKMQDKIDSATQKANDAISTVTTALNAMSNALAQRTDKQGDEWNRFKEDILKTIREASK